jgi:hypothetical protein
LETVSARPYLHALTGSAGRNPGLWLLERIPSSLRRSSFLLEIWQWLGLLILLALGLFLGRLFTRRGLSGARRKGQGGNPQV